MRLHAGMSLRVLVSIVAMLGALAFGAARAGATPLTEFKLPAGDAATNLIEGPDGALWFSVHTSGNKSQIGRITTSGALTFKDVNTVGDISSMALAANGTIWFSISDGAQGVGELTPTGVVTIINPGMGGLNTGAIPNEMTDSPDGSVWFLDHSSTSPGAGQISPAGTITEYPDSNGSPPEDLTIGAGNKAWFTTHEGNMVQFAGVGVALPGKPAGTMATVYATNSASFMMTMPSGITDGPDGNVWWTDQGTPPGVGKVTPAGTVSEFGMGNGLQMNAVPDAIMNGPAGKLWFDDQYGGNDAIGTITTAGAIAEHKLKGTPWDLTTGIDGNVWIPWSITMGDTGVYRVNAQTAKVDTITSGMRPTSDMTDTTNITSGPDGNLWFIDDGTPEAIVRADVRLPPVVTTGAASSVTNTSAHIAGTANSRGAASTATVQYGKTPSLGSTAKAGTLAGANASSPVAATLTGLTPGTKLYYRVSATNAYGSVNGATKTLTTTGTAPGGGAGARTVHATIGDQRITLTLPPAKVCLAAGTRLKLKVETATISAGKGAKLHVRRLAVFVDRGIKKTKVKVVVRHHHKHRHRVVVRVPNVTRNHLPASLKLSLRHLKSGSHSLRVKLTLKGARRVGHHTVHVTVSKTIKLSFRVC